MSVLVILYDNYGVMNRTPFFCSMKIKLHRETSTATNAPLIKADDCAGLRRQHIKNTLDHLHPHEQYSPRHLLQY